MVMALLERYSTSAKADFHRIQRLSKCVEGTGYQTQIRIKYPWSKGLHKPGPDRQLRNDFFNGPGWQKGNEFFQRPGRATKNDDK